MSFNLSFAFLTLLVVGWFLVLRLRGKKEGAESKELFY